MHNVNAEFASKSARLDSPKLNSSLCHIKKIAQRKIQEWNLIAEQSFEQAGLPCAFDNQSLQTPLHIAIAYRRQDLLIRLIQEGANLREKNACDISPLHYACLIENWSAAHTILDAFSEEIKEKKKAAAHSLLYMLSGKQYELAQKYLRKQKTIDTNWGYIRDNTPLHFACKKDVPMEILQHLIARKWGLNAQNASKNTPLHVAIKQDRPELIPLLVKAGALLTIQNEDEHTPPRLAAKLQRWACQEALIKNGIFYLKDEADLASILLYAIKGKQFHIAKLFLNHTTLGANRVDRATNRTPLHWAIINQAPLEICTALLKNSNPNAADKEGNTPLHYAIQKGKPDLVALLAEEGGGFVFRNNEGNSPLMLASSADHVSCLDALLNSKQAYYHALERPNYHALKADVDALREVLLATLQINHIISARKILASIPSINNGNKAYLQEHLKVCIINRAPLDIIYMLMEKGANPRDYYCGQNAINLAKERGCHAIERVLTKSKNYVIDTEALKEFFKLFFLEHCLLSKLSKEMLLLIAEKLGHDHHFAGELLKESFTAANETKKLFCQLQAGVDYYSPVDKEKLYYELLDQYGCVPEGLKTALFILKNLPGLSPPSLWGQFNTYFFPQDKASYRQQQIAQLTELLAKRTPHESS